MKVHLINPAKENKTFCGLNTKREMQAAQKKIYITSAAVFKVLPDAEKCLNCKKELK